MKAIEQFFHVVLFIMLYKMVLASMSLNKPQCVAIQMKATKQYFHVGFLLGHLNALLRGLIIGRLGKYGHPATLAEARQRFDAHCKGESTIPADLRSAVYSTVLKHGDDVTLDSIMKLFREADLHEEKVRLMRCMGTVSQPELIKKVLDFSMSVGLLYLQQQPIP